MKKPMYVRLIVFILLLVISVIFMKCNIPFMEQAGGFYVQFESIPSGASVRLANVYYVDNDPFLLNERNSNIRYLPQATSTSANLSMGQYWVVFEYQGERIQKLLYVRKPEVLRVSFE